MGGLVASGCRHLSDTDADTESVDVGLGRTVRLAALAFRWSARAEADAHVGRSPVSRV